MYAHRDDLSTLKFGHLQRAYALAGWRPEKGAIYLTVGSAWR